MNKPNYLCDMHSHTTRSDGLCSVKEFIDLAHDMGMKVVTISDHDTLPPTTVLVDNNEVDVLKYAKDKGVHLLRACEFSCDTEVDDVHIVVYGCDFSHPKILEQIKKIEDYKVESYMDFFNKVNDYGFKISLDDVLNYGGEKRDKILQKKLIFNVIADKGYTKTWADAKLLSNKEPKLKVKRKKPSPVDIIKIAHEAGGIAILAHPYLINEKVKCDGNIITRDEYINLLIKSGLDGIEASYTYDKTSYNGAMTKEAIEKEVREKYENKVKIISGGSDFHGDYKNNKVNPRYFGECGITFEYFMNNELLKKLI